MAEVLKKLVIITTNLLIYYSIMEVNYAKPFFLSKLIVLDIKFEVFREKTLLMTA